MNFDLVMAKAALDGVENRIRNHLETTMWAKGQLLQHIAGGSMHKTSGSIPQHLTQLLPGTTTAQGAADLERLARMAKSIGPRILRLKQYGTLGSINWGDGSPTFDKELDNATTESLRAFPRDRLARKALQQDLVRGMLAGIVIPDGSGRAQTMPLGGYYEPLVNEDNIEHVWGIYQAWLPPTGRKWRARIYNLETRELLEWDNMDNPTDLGMTPASIPNAPMPVFEIVDDDLDGLPRGEFMESLPLFKSEWASQVRGDRAEESTAFSQLVTKGQLLTGDNERGATRVIRLPADGDAHYLDPPSLEQIHKHHDRKLERLRVDHSLPGGFLGGQTPSGEALREANQSFIADCSGRAGRISNWLTRLLSDYGEITGLKDPPPVTVVINREFERGSVVDQTVLLHREGLIDFGEAVRAISVYYPTWSSAAVEAFIETERARMTLPVFVPGRLDPKDVGDDA